MNTSDQRRILIVRTDRMGDVILSTPVIRALRRALPRGYLAMMVQPANRELVEGNPDLNAVILFDKKGPHRSWGGMLRLAGELKAHRFDTAVILHSTNRVLLAAWWAGIRRRVGYARRLPWLLTQRLPYLKREGERHEREYNLELLRLIGLEPSLAEPLCVPARASDEEQAQSFLESRGVNPARPLVVLHPGASCPSKRWPPERFAAVADRLVERHNVQVAIVTGPGEQGCGEAVLSRMRQPAAPAFGDLSLGELASVLRRSRCLVSNDSGPVHLACAVGAPVVALFGRWGGGLSPVRWGPTGPGSLALHHDVGCRPCLAHRCPIGFICLEAITVEEVVAAAEYVMRLNVHA